MKTLTITIQDWSDELNGTDDLLPFVATLNEDPYKGIFVQGVSLFDVLQKLTVSVALRDKNQSQGICGIVQ